MNWTDILSRPATHDQRRFFRFHSDMYFFEVFRWILKDGTEYVDGECNGRFEQQDLNKLCYGEIQWRKSDIKNGSIPEFFSKMDGLFYPRVSNFKQIHQL